MLARHAPRTGLIAGNRRGAYDSVTYKGRSGLGEIRMPDQPNQPGNERFKAEMPAIPGVGGPSPKKSVSGGPWLVVGGLIAVLAAVFVGGKVLSKPRHSDPPPAPAPQLEVPAPVPDLTASVPIATEQDPVIASVSELKPWASKEFIYRNGMTGETVSALVVRLPIGASNQAAGYWSFAMRAAYGNCRLEYVEDLQKLKDDYGFRQAKHPMIGNPCSRTLFDPLKYAPLPGGVLARGAIVQGSDLRPPLGIEVKVKGKDILAIRME